MHQGVSKSVLLAFVLVSIASGTMASPQTDQFRAATLAIHPGMSEAKVIQLLGAPEKLFGASETPVATMKAKKGLVYWYPEWATVFFVVGVTHGKVKGASMCRALGSRVWKTEKCQTPSSFWRENP